MIWIEAVAAVEKISSIERTACRNVFEKRFTATRMAEEYVDLYQSMVSTSIDHTISAALLDFSSFAGNRPITIPANPWQDISVADIVRVKDQYYVKATSALADDRTRVLKYGDTFAVLNRYGDIEPLGFGQFGLVPLRNAPSLAHDHAVKSADSHAAELHHSR